MTREIYDISVILPTYNERKNILTILHRLVKLSKTNDFRIQAVVVDDNSPDGTAESIKSYNFTNVVLINRTKERGLATAIRDGLRSSSGNIVVVMDTDLNHDPNLIPKLVNNLKKSTMVIGSRFVKNGGMDNRLRYFYSKVYNKYFLARILKSRVSDNLSGYFVMFRKELIPFVSDDIFFGYGDYFLRLIFALKQSGFTFVEVPCHYKNRTYGQSKSKFIHMLFSYSIEAVKYVHKFNK